MTVTLHGVKIGSENCELFTYIPVTVMRAFKKSSTLIYALVRSVSYRVVFIELVIQKNI